MQSKEAEHVERRKYKNRLRNWWYFKRIIISRWIKHHWKQFLEKGHESITLMFMPHGAEQKVYRLRISKFVMFFVIGTVALIIVYSVHAYRGADQQYEQIAELDMVSAGQDILFRTYSRHSARLLRNAEPVRKELLALSDLFGSQELQSYFPALYSNVDTEVVPEEFREAYGADFYFTEELLRLGVMGRMLDRGADMVARLNRFLRSYRYSMRRIPSLWPVARGGGVITSSFGYRVNPFSGAYGLHTGIDIAYVRGALIRAAAPGTVMQAEEDRGYGLAVVIRHDYGFYTRYAHLDEIFVIEDLKVRRGEPIGTMGDSGNTTGVHLHYEVIIDGQPVDPASFLRPFF